MKEALLTAKEIVKTYPDRQDTPQPDLAGKILPSSLWTVWGGQSTLLYALSGMDKYLIFLFPNVTL